MKIQLLAIIEAINHFGSQVAMAEFCEVTPAAVSQWANGTRPIPARFCVRLESRTGVSRSRLRPDDWRDYWPDYQDEVAEKNVL